MQTISERKLLKQINSGEPFKAALLDGSIEVCVREYVPWVCVALHAGHRMRSNLEALCMLTEKERQHEEDTYTDQLIEPMPISVIVRDSRYEYDLNRSPDQALYETAWGQQVWRKPLNDSQKAESIAKYTRFYRIFYALISRLERHFGGCLLIDLHSYNWQIRKHGDAPVFNTGTRQLDLRKAGKWVKALEDQLRTIELPQIETSVGRNIVFRGDGYLATYCREHLARTVVIPLEVKKIFMDETDGELFPVVFEQLKQGLFNSVHAVGALFSEQFAPAVHVAAPKIDPLVIQVDEALYRLGRGVETLVYVNPINAYQEKRSFLARAHYQPHFRYRQLRIDPYSFRESLYALPINKIEDPALRDLYRSVVEGYATKIDMLTSLGTPEFLYNSLRYYGEPTKLDLANAQFLLHAAAFPNQLEEPRDIDALTAKAAFSEAIAEYDSDFRVQLTGQIVAKAMVDNTRRVVTLNERAQLSKTELNALIAHEFGIHVLTTMNADDQPLKVLRLGLPGSTYTQEGLAILSEYLSGNLTLSRLRTLALRVLVIHMMVEGMSFSSIYSRLREEYHQSKDDAFSLTVRAFRGGGFTKDHLYLAGFRDIISLYRQRNLSALLVGKTSTRMLKTLDQLMEREILHPPKYLPHSFTDPTSAPPLLDYLIDSLQPADNELATASAPGR